MIINIKVQVFFKNQLIKKHFEYKLDSNLEKEISIKSLLKKLDSTKVFPPKFFHELIKTKNLFSIFLNGQFIELNQKVSFKNGDNFTILSTLSGG